MCVHLRRREAKKWREEGGRERGATERDRRQ